MKKLNIKNIFKAHLGHLTDFEIGQIEACNYIINNLRREIQRLENFELGDFLKNATDPTYNAKYLTTLQNNQHFLYQIELYKKDIVGKGDEK